MTAKQQGFCVRIPRRNGSASIDLIHAGAWCSVHEAEGLKLLLYGEVFGDEGRLDGREILSRFKLKGGECAQDFDGAYVLVFIQASQETAVVITDRLNALKCFVEETRDAIFLASSLYFLPKIQRRLDSIGVTSFLANGVVHCNRTIWEGVRSLK